MTEGRSLFDYDINGVALSWKLDINYVRGVSLLLQQGIIFHD